MNYELLVDTAVLAGELMLRSGAETYRVEDTMHHILKTSGLEVTDSLVLMTGIMASISGKDVERITAVKRVNERSTNLNRVVRVNDISRRYCGGELTLEETYQELDSIEGKVYNNRVVYNLATIGVVVGFAMLFGGGWLEIAVAALTGLLLAFLITGGKKLGVNVFILDIISSMGIALLTIFLKQYITFDVDSDIVIVSAIMPLVPGVAITNAVRDTLQGDYISGGARVLEAFLKAAAIALGVGLGMACFSGVVGGGGF